MKKRKLPTLKEALKQVKAMDGALSRAAKLTQLQRARLNQLVAKRKEGQ